MVKTLQISIIRKVFHEYANLQEATDDFVLPPYAHGDIQKKVIFDPEAYTYLLVALGWNGARRIHGCIVHIDIIDMSVRSISCSPIRCGILVGKMGLK
jgi:hypothetical protein